MSMPLPLAGLHVLTSGEDGATAACARILAHLGAAVCATDPARLGSPCRQPSVGAAPLPGTAIAAAPPPDILVLGLRPAEARTVGLAPSDLVAPGRAVVWITPYGLDGLATPGCAAGSPHRDTAPQSGGVPSVGRPVDAAAQAGSDPVVADALTGAHAAVAALAALRWARRHQRGVLVEVAALEVIATCLGDLLPRAICPRAQRGAPPSVARWPGAGAASADHPASAPAPAPHHLTVLPCADGYVGLSAPTPTDRELLAALTGIAAVGDPAADLAPLLGPWLRARNRAEVFHAAQLWRLPVVPVLTPAEARQDPQSAARTTWRQRDGQWLARSPYRFTPPTTVRSDATETGVHRHIIVGQGFFPCRPAHDATLTLGSRPPGTAAAPLADLRVLDLGMVWAGPYCARLLAGLGARVVKIEGPQRRDGTRPPEPDAARPGRRAGNASPATDADCAGAFADLNRGKESLVLDLASPAGRTTFLRLAAHADVVLENFSPRVMPNFGLAHGTLARTNPGLLMLSLPAFGSDGPWAHYVAYGSGLELATGLAAQDAAGRPSPAPVAYLDYLAGAYGAAGLLAALLARDRTGQGAHLEVAQREVAGQVLAVAGDEPRRPWTLDLAALAADPLLIARGLLAPTVAPRSPGAGRCHHYARLPWWLHGVPTPRERSAPAYGAHSRRILRDLVRLAPAEVDVLVQVGVVVAARPKPAPPVPTAPAPDHPGSRDLLRAGTGRARAPASARPGRPGRRGTG
jgi:crotonobetainyl-CoA:carnitine CoA-transferase CaiB-like acyl-CoA transferase